MSRACIHISVIATKLLLNSCFILQTSTRARLDTMLHETEISNCSLKREVDVLKSGISEIVQIVSGKENAVNPEPTPTKPVHVISGKGSITIPVKGKKRQQETNEQAASPLFSQVSSHSYNEEC